MNFNPIQMGADFTSWYMSDVEIRVRGMVDELLFYNRHGIPISPEVVERELYELGLRYSELPQFCRDMIDELELD
jgi:hypothetical protein